jgi:ABC-type sugar transport system ATPase subunit
VEGLYENMSTSDNLLLPSLRKICSPKIAMPGKTVREAAMKEWTNGAQVPGRVNELSGLAQLSLQMESWMMFRPKAMILVDPFWGIDDESRSLLVRYLLRFRKQGCGILVISADSHREAEYIGGRWFDAHTTGV